MLNTFADAVQDLEIVEMLFFMEEIETQWHFCMTFCSFLLLFIGKEVSEIYIKMHTRQIRPEVVVEDELHVA